MYHNHDFLSRGFRFRPGEAKFFGSFPAGCGTLGESALETAVFVADVARKYIAEWIEEEAHCLRVRKRNPSLFLPDIALDTQGCFCFRNSTASQRKHQRRHA
jgi:hypothetical protein